MSQSEPSVTVPFGAWYEQADLPLTFPAGWRVQRMDPVDAAAMSERLIDEAFARPIETDPLHRLAAGKRTAAVAVDDLTRPTPAHVFLPRIIEELERGGLAAADIRILLGTAAHRPMDRTEITKKLGAGIVDRFEPIMHDFVGRDIRHVGWVHGGPVYLNRHFLDADLRICVGGVIPHGETGFGGGAKMVVPGLAGRLTIAHFHGALPARPAGRLEARNGTLDRRAWSEQVARHIGVDAVVCAVVNARCELAGLYVGDVVAAHRSAARHAARIGRTIVPRDLARRADVVVVNAYPLDTDPIQMGKSVSLARGLSPQQTVVINAASDGIFYHGMGMGSGVSVKRLLRNVPRWLVAPISQWSWLRSMTYGVRSPGLAARTCYFSLNHLSYAEFRAGAAELTDAGPLPADAPDQADPLVLSERFPAAGFRRKYRHGRLCRDWNELRDILGRRFAPTTALVFPCAPLQMVEIG